MVKNYYLEKLYVFTDYKNLSSIKSLIKRNKIIVEIASFIVKK